MKIIFYILINIILTIVVVLVVHNMTKSKYGYIEVNKVFVEFEMKKELETKYNVIKENRKKTLDSLKEELSMLESKLEKSKDEKLLELYNDKKKIFLEKVKEFDDFNNSMVDKLDKEIFNKINEYTELYAKEHDYEIIYGAKGDGNFMYIEASKNITTDVIEFINYKFKNKNNKD
ncbi:MAG: hypothetical protein A2X12_02575 [Bacteroidetes bacterium GWE2_29_8]|nr:MAG: hypothetical protein A2X12_02575 [Bacteroidetes bacterium GWE2_29_8]